MQDTAEEITVQKKPYWGAWPSTGFGCLIFIAEVFVSMIVGIVFLIVKFSSNPAATMDRLLPYLMVNGLFFTLSAGAAAIVGIGLIMVFIRMRRTLSITEYIGLRPISVKVLLICLGIAAGLVVLIEGLSFLLGQSLTPDWEIVALRTSDWPVMPWVTLVIFVPIFEETLFRGFLFEGFRQSRLGVIGAVILTAFLWALSHTQYDAYALFMTFVLGIALGLVRYKTSSLWSVLVMHAFINLVAMIQITFLV